MTMITRKFSLLRHLLWAATLATGFGTLWFVVMIWLTTSIQEAWQDRVRLRQESIVVRSDGTPLIRSIPLDYNLSLTTYRDLNGQVRGDADDRDLLTPVYLPGEHAKPGFFSSRPGWQGRLEVFLNEQEPTVIWYFVHDGKAEGAGYFVGYERTSNRRVGFIGLSGFRAELVPISEWIPVRGALMMDFTYWSSAPTWIYGGRVQVPQSGPTDLPPRWVYVPSGNLLRKVDLAARTVTTVFEAPDPIESPGIASLPSSFNGSPIKEHRILVRTRQQVVALDQKHKVVGLFTVPTEVDRQSQLNWYEIGEGKAIAELFQSWSAREADNATNRIVYRIGADGVIQDRFELTLQTGSPATNQVVLQTQVFLGLPAPAFLFVVEPLFMMSTDRTGSYPNAFIGLLATLWPSLLAVVALASILAFITRRRCHSFGLRKKEQVAWVVFVLLLGLPAFVGFLLSRRWPIRQPCPTCHSQAPGDRAACADCGARFPDPALKGIEIFA
jgi:hypothetical protein